MRTRALPPLLFTLLTLFTITFPAAGAAANGETGRTLTLSEAVERALGFRPEIAAARSERRLAASALAESRAALWPTLSATATVSHHDEPVPVTPIHGFGTGAAPDFETSLVQGGLQLGYTLWDGGRRSAGIDRAGAEAEAAGAGLSAAEQAVAARAVDGYLQVLALGTTLEAADARIGAVEAERRRVEQMLEVGRAAEVDLRRAEAALAAARADRTNLASALDTAERHLARLIGGDPDETRHERLVPLAAVADAVADAGPLPERTALYRSLEANPSLIAEERRLAAAKAAVEVARSSSRPTLSAVSDLQELGSTNGGFEGEWSAGLRLSVPLFQGGALEERKVQAEAARDGVAEGLRSTRLELASLLDRALSTFEGARARQRALAEAQRQYAEVARIEKLRLETGVGIQADYLDAEAALLDARAGLAEALRTETVARVEVARLTGALDLAWIGDRLE